MSTLPENFQELVELDLRDKCTEDQMDVLENNLDDWRAELLLSLTALDRQFSNRRSDVIADGTTQVKKDYTAWKAKAVGRKHAIVNRLQDVKIMIKERNVDIKADEHPSENSSVVGSPANRAQMSAMILAANIRAGVKNPVKTSLDQLRELCEGLVRHE
jgi:hypothetical protein